VASLIRYFPLEGSPEWHQGAACMANDPLDVGRYNSRLKFVNRVGTGKERLLFPRRPILFATRVIREGEEIFFRYGSKTPLKGV